MNASSFRPTGLFRWAPIVAALIVAFPSQADVLRLVNGDRYNGRLASVDARFVHFESEIQGAIKLPRAKVAAIEFGGALSSAKSLPSAVPSAPAPLASPEEVLREIRRKGVEGDAVDQVREQFLKDADPEARKQFNEMVSGLLSGQLSLGDIRKQAEDAAGQIRTLQGELGEETGALLEGYLSILENFLAKTPSGSDSSPGSKDRPTDDKAPPPDSDKD